MFVGQGGRVGLPGFAVEFVRGLLEEPGTPGDFKVRNVSYVVQ